MAVLNSSIPVTWRRCFNGRLVWFKAASGVRHDLNAQEVSFAPLSSKGVVQRWHQATLDVITGRDAGAATSRGARAAGNPHAEPLAPRRRHNYLPVAGTLAEQNCRGGGRPRHA